MGCYVSSLYQLCNFEEVLDLPLHIEQHHPNSIPCNTCERWGITTAFRDVVDRQQHISLCHRGPQTVPNYCSKCDGQYYEESHICGTTYCWYCLHVLPDHLKSHSCDRRIKCELCFQWMTYSGMGPHMYGHGNGPYKCTTCRKSARWEGVEELRGHITNHHCQQWCQWCGGEFTLKTIKRHVELHHNPANNFKCWDPKCRYPGGNSWNDIAQHVSTEHPAPRTDQKPNSRGTRPSYRFFTKQGLVLLTTGRTHLFKNTKGEDTPIVFLTPDVVGRYRLLEKRGASTVVYSDGMS